MHYYYRMAESWDGNDRQERSIEQIAEGGIRDLFKHLQRDVPRQTISAHMRGYRADPTYLESMAFRSENDHVRRLALFAVAMEEMNKKLISRMKGTVSPVTAGVSDAGEVRISAKSVQKSFQRSESAGFAELRKYSILRLGRAVDQSFEAPKKRTEALRSKLELAIHLHFPFGVRPNDVIRQGLITAADTVWGILATIPVQYEREYGEPITREIYAAMMPEAKRLVQFLASSRLDVQAEGFAPVVQGDRKAYVERPIMRGLLLEKNEDAWRIDFDKQTLVAIAHRYESTKHAVQNATAGRPQIGCPVLYVFDDSGESFVGRYFDWALSLTERYFLPRLAKPATPA